MERSLNMIIMLCLFPACLLPLISDRLKGKSSNIFNVKPCTNLYSLCSVTEEMGKPGSDAGMPGIEDSEVGKIDDVQFGKQWS